MPNLASSEILRSVRPRVNKNLSGHDTELCYVSSCECCLAGAHNLERTTPILGLSHGVFTDGFIFRYILQQFFSWKLHLSITTFEVYIMIKETKTSSKSEGVL